VLSHIPFFVDVYVEEHNAKGKKGEIKIKPPRFISR
jgi:hypothetical protein